MALVLAEFNYDFARGVRKVYCTTRQFLFFVGVLRRVCIHLLSWIFLFVVELISASSLTMTHDAFISPFRYLLCVAFLLILLGAVQHYPCNGLTIWRLVAMLVFQLFHSINACWPMSWLHQLDFRLYPLSLSIDGFGLFFHEATTNLTKSI